MKNLASILALSTLLLLLSACVSKHAEVEGKEIKMQHARNLKMMELSDGSTFVSIRNPWDTTKTLCEYVLVGKDNNVPDVPEGTQIVRVPLQKSVVYSGVHLSLIEELGAGGSVNGVCDIEYINDKKIRQAVKSGGITDCGNSISPNIEVIIKLRPQAIILSPYENSNEVSKLSKTGIPVVQAADYMESSPLGRAEWMRFIGRLYGKGAEADKLYEKISNEYETLSKRALATSDKPEVLLDMIYNGFWSVPTSGSVTGRLIKDAGGRTAFEKYSQGGSANLSPEEVLVAAQNSDIWLIRHFQLPSNLDEFGAWNPIYTKFKAYKDGKVYVSDTMHTTLFEDGAFHPERILKEMILILHPELLKDSPQLNYYNKLQK